MLIINNKALKVGNKWLNPIASPEPTPPEPPTPTYEEVTIGNQTWMTTNLAIDDGQGGVYIKENVISNDVNIGTQYYYSIQAATRIVSNIEGWHIPSKAEWQTLLNTVGNNNISKIMSTEGWPSGYNGTNELGMNILPAGEIDNDSSLTLYTGFAFFWTSTVGSVAQPSGNYQGCMYIYNNTPTFQDNSYATLEQAQYYNQVNVFMSVRLIKDT